MSNASRKKHSRNGNVANYNAYPAQRIDGSSSALEVNEYGELKIASRELSYANITTSNNITTSQSRIYGIYVNTTSAGTFRIYDGLNTSGIPVTGVITPAVGFHNFLGIYLHDGLYILTTGTINLTVIYEEIVIPADEPTGGEMN